MRKLSLVTHLFQRLKIYLTTCSHFVHAKNMPLYDHKQLRATSKKPSETMNSMSSSRLKVPFTHLPTRYQSIKHYNPFLLVLQFQPFNFWPPKLLWNPLISNNSVNRSELGEWLVTVRVSASFFIVFSNAKIARNFCITPAMVTTDASKLNENADHQL